GVEVELQGGREPDPRLLADLGADDPLGALERRGSPFTLLVVAVDRVEHRGVLQVTGHAYVGDGHEPETRVLDPGVEHLRHDDLDAGRELASPGLVDRGSALSSEGPAGSQLRVGPSGHVRNDQLRRRGAVRCGGSWWVWHGPPGPR